MAETIYDITIIGGGPVGIFAAFYAGLREARVQLIESLPELGGQVNALYPEKKILDVAGLPAVRGHALISQQMEQLKEFPVTLKTNQAVTDIIRTTDGFQVVTEKETSKTKSVIVAVGNGSFSPRKLAIENNQEFENRHLFYSVSDLQHFRDKRVLVAGGGDSAVDQALLLTEVAQSVTLVHRRTEFRALEHTVSKLNSSSVVKKTPYLIKAINEGPDGLEVSLKKMRTEAPLETQIVDDVVVSYGFTSDHKVVDGWHLNLATDRHLFKVDSTMATSEPGVYAIGDGVTYPGKQALIASGFGEAPIAVSSAMTQMYPERRGVVHSTSLSKD